MDIFKRRTASQDEYIHYLIEVQRARTQWQNSIKYFESVSEEDLVEYAIYEMEASKRQYICMLTRLRGMYFELKKNADTYILQEHSEIGEIEDLKFKEDSNVSVAKVSQDKA